MTWLRQRILSKMNQMMRDYETSSTLKKAMISTFMHRFPGLMTCAEFDDFMADYVDGNLSDTDKRKFNFHLEGCPICRSHLSKYRVAVKLAQLSADHELPAVPQELIDAILASRSSQEK